MNNKPLDRNGLTVFHISHFSCEAQWQERETHNLISSYIEVKIYLHGSQTPLMRQLFPVEMTLQEIKQRTAFYILKEVGVMWDTVNTYYKQHVS